MERSCDTSALLLACLLVVVATLLLILPACGSIQPKGSFSLNITSGIAYAWSSQGYLQVLRVWGA
jgi:ammonia channel protein AmtB